jgi:hypothetical protein
VALLLLAGCLSIFAYTASSVEILSSFHIVSRIAYGRTGNWELGRDFCVEHQMVSTTFSLDRDSQRKYLRMGNIAAMQDLRRARGFLFLQFFLPSFGLEFTRGILSAVFSKGCA